MADWRVAMVYGGPSAEHEVSLDSAATVLGSLVAGGAAILPVRLDREGTWSLGPWLDQLPPSPLPALVRQASWPRLSPGAAIARLEEESLDVVFPVVHGALGEDGCLQGLMRMLDLPCVGCSVRASAIAMHKSSCKAILAATTSVSLLPGVELTSAPLERQAPEVVAAARQLAYPCVIKPVDGGSSVGVLAVESPADLATRLTTAVREVPASKAFLLEERAVGDEVTCTVIGTKEGFVALPPILIRPHDSDLFDYRAKYTPGQADEICPAPLPEPLLQRLARDSIHAFHAIGGVDLGRLDFIVQDGTPYLLEVNTVPGYTTGSLVPLAARTAGWRLPDFFLHLVRQAATRCQTSAGATA